MFDECERMGLAISKSNGYRTRRPKKRPQKSKNHGQKWTDRVKREKLRRKEYVRPLVVKKVKLPTFLVKHLAGRPEARSQQYESKRALLSRGATTLTGS
jgi:hypothetical protein